MHRLFLLILVLLGLSGCRITAKPTSVPPNPTHITAQASPETVVELWNDLYLAQRYGEIEPLYTPELVDAYTNHGQYNFAEYLGKRNPLGKIDHSTHDPAIYTDVDHAQVRTYDFYSPTEVKNDFTSSSVIYFEQRNGLWYICGANNPNSTTPYACPSSPTPTP